MSTIITIDLGEGRTDDLKITSNSDLSQLAKSFCAKHNLPPESSVILLNEIKKTVPSLKSDVQSNPTLQKPSHYPNVGVKLYEKGQKYIEIITNKLEKFKKKRKESEQKNLTFSPSINKSKFESGFEVLLRAGLQTEQKLEKMRGEKLNKEINSCTFSPKINRKSIELKRKSLTPDKDFSTSFGSSAATSWNLMKNNQPSVYELLYQDARSKSEMKKKSVEKFYKTSFAFKPNLAATMEISSKLLKNKGNQKKISDYRKELDHYLRVKALNTDLETGQELFKPQISPYPTHERKFQSPCRTFSPLNRSNTRLTSEKSEKIVKRIWLLRFQKIFNTLSPENGKISNQGVKNASIDSQLKKLLSPVLEKIGDCLEFEDFRKEMEELLLRMTPENREFVIKGERFVTARPKSVQASPVNLGIYERNLEKVRKTKERIERMRMKKKESEVKGCTFTPSTVRYSSPKKFREIWMIGRGLNENSFL